MDRNTKIENNEYSPNASDVICKIEPIESPGDIQDDEPMNSDSAKTSYSLHGIGRLSEHRHSLGYSDAKSEADGTNDSKPELDYDCEASDKEYTSSQSSDSSLGENTALQDGRQVFNKLPVKTIRCNQCGEYIDKDLFRSHINSLHPNQDVKFVCEVCGKGYKFESSLILHKSNHHNGLLVQPGGVRNEPILDLRSQSQMLCKICGKSFRHATSFTVHLQNHQLEKIFECEVCYNGFIIKSDLDDHMNVHANLEQNQCFICEKKCRNPAAYESHLRKHSNESKHKCSKCPRFFKEESDLAIHTVKHSLCKHLQCRICKQRFPSKTEKDKHYKKHINEWRCHLCGKTFVNRGLLSTHTNVVHPKKDLFSCNFCEEKFNNNKELQKHRLVHMDKKVCHFCGDEFGLRSELIKHLEIHSNKTVYRCVVCPEWCFTKKKLEEHVGNHKEEVLDCCVCGQQLSDSSEVMVHVMQHDRKSSAEGSMSSVKCGLQERRMEECHICAKTFHFVSSLQSHLRVHEKDQILRCHICAKEFKGIKMLREHIGTHENTTAIDVPKEGEKFKHRCEICLEKFRNYYTCKKHRLLHTGEKSFKCDFCGKTFVLAGALKVHRLSHVENKPHVCEICGKSFKQPYILREHQMTHTGIKPFLCDLCGKSFVNRKKLQLHVFVHTRETPFNCKVCKKGFRASITRKKHKCTGPPESEASDGQLAENPYFVLDSVQHKDTFTDQGNNCYASSTSVLAESVSSSDFQTITQPDEAFLQGVDVTELPAISTEVPEENPYASK